MTEDNKTIRIEPVTRLEGHGEVTLTLSKTGTVKDVQFNVTSTRFFEKILEGRFAEEAPIVSPRICGICPTPHHLASVKAVEAAWDIVPPPAAVKVRRLMLNAKQVSSHGLHFYALAAPDFVAGPFGSPALRNVAAIIKALPEVGKTAIRVMQFGQELVGATGGRAVHSVTAVPGGLLNPFSEQKRDEFLKRVESIKEAGIGTLELVEKLVDDYSDLITRVAVVPTYYVGLHNSGDLEIYDGPLRVMSPQGEIVAEFKPKDYKKYFGEYVSDHSYVSCAFYLPAGYPEGIWRAGPLARCNIADKMSTPLAQKALERMRARLGRTIHATFAYHWARVIELVQAIEEIEQLLNDPQIVSTDVKLSTVTPKKGTGVGIVEAPRGTLVHHYATDEKGIITRANLIVSTNNNVAAIEKSLFDAARGLLEEQIHTTLRLPEPMLKSSNSRNK